MAMSEVMRQPREARSLHGGRDYPRNFPEFLERFSSESACLTYLEGLRWDERFVCPHCGVVDGGYWRMRDGWRRCAACRKECSATSGTILQGTRYPLQTWFHVIWYVVAQKNGVSALGLQRVLGLGSYKTAWAWMHKLRRAMVVPGRDLLAGPVEVDETFVGGVKSGARGRATGGKAIVAIAVEARENGPGRVRMRRINDTSQASLTPVVEDFVEPGSEVQTDAWGGYNELDRMRAYSHTVTNLSASGEPAHVSMPHVHRVASLFKRWLLGTHQGGIAWQQLDYYMDEFTFRFNRRHSRYRGLLFYRLMEGVVATTPKPYRELITGVRAAREAARNGVTR
jgi:transposase-like protein